MKIHYLIVPYYNKLESNHTFLFLGRSSRELTHHYYLHEFIRFDSYKEAKDWILDLFPNRIIC